MWLAEALRVVGNALGLAAKRQELNNTPEMLKARQAQEEAAAKDNSEQAVKERNEEAMRKHLGD